MSVKAQHKAGSAIAAVAEVLGCEYDEALKLFGAGAMDAAQDGGFTPDQIRSALAGANRRAWIIHPAVSIQGYHAPNTIALSDGVWRARKGGAWTDPKGGDATEQLPSVPEVAIRCVRHHAGEHRA